jgi:hypothetical protein
MIKSKLRVSFFGILLYSLTFMSLMLIGGFTLAYADGSYTVSGTATFGPSGATEPAGDEDIELTNLATGARESTTRTNGTYSLSNVPDGTYSVNIYIFQLTTLVVAQMLQPP